MSAARTPSGPPRRALVRWSWRMFRKEWRQQLLVLSLVTIAVAIAVAGSSMAMNAANAIEPGFGTAEAMARVEITDHTSAADAIATAKARFGPVEAIGHASVALPGSADRIDIRAQDPEGRYGRTMLALVDGRYPTAASDVALTRSIADLLSVDVGDTVDLGRQERHVVGIVENPTGLGDDFALVAPDQIPSATSLTLLFARPGTAGASAGTGATSGAERGATGPVDMQVSIRGTAGPVAALVLIAVTLAMALVGLIAAAGFVVVAQRRQRQLGLLAAIGATERHLRLVVVANGAIVGVVAAAAGTIIGVTGWILATPAVEQAARHRVDRFDLPWAVVAGCAAVAVIVSVVAAWWPARRMARIPIMTALSGRPPAPAPVHRSILVAVLGLGLGVVAIASAIGPNDRVRPLLLIAGIMAVAIGTVFVAPAAIRIGAAPAARLPLPGRLALRDLARFQARAAAALAAITFVVGISVTIVAIAQANQYHADEGNLSSHQILVQGQHGGGPDDPAPVPSDAQLTRADAAVQRLGDAIDGAQVLPLAIAIPTAPDPEAGPVRPISEARKINANSWNEVATPVVATPELLAHYGIDAGTIDSATDLLTGDHRNVLLLDTSTRKSPGETPLQRVDLPAYTSAPRALITEAAMERHGWTPVRSAWLVDSPNALTTKQIAAARAAVAEAGLTIEVRSTQDTLARLRTITTGVGALVALAIVAMTVGLIRSESARDLRTLTATGASSGIRRALTASTAGALALLGVVLGTGGAYLALLAGYHRDLSRLQPVPWPHLVALAIGLPLLAAAAGWALGGREPATFSRQTFD